MSVTKTRKYSSEHSSRTEDDSASISRETAAHSAPETRQHPFGSLLDLSAPMRDEGSSEREAPAKTEGNVSAVQNDAATTLMVQRKEDGQEDGGWFGGLGDMASSAWGGIKSGASAVASGVSSAQKWGDGALKTASDTASGWVDSGEKMYGQAIHSAADSVKDVPILGSVASVGADMAEFGSQVGGGILKGAGSMVGGLAHTVMHPLQTLQGIETMAEHAPIGMGLPGMNPLKALHTGYDYLAGNKTGEQALNALNPINSVKDDINYWKTVGGEIAKPYSQSVKDGKPGEAFGRGIFDIGSMFLGVGEAGAAAKGASVAGKVGEAGEIASTVAKVTEAGEIAADVAKVTEAGEIASDTAKVTEAGEVATAASELGEAEEAVQQSSNAAHNAADFEKLKADLAAQEIEGATSKGSALKGGSDHVRSKKIDGVEGVREVSMDVDAHHSAPIYERGRAKDGRVFPLKGGDGKTRNLTQVEGAVNGKEGIHEWIVDENGNLVHEQFRPGGGVNGEVGGKPKFSE